MKKIACVGFHATGAGVIDDLLRECENVAQGFYEAESRILHDADGVSDLEFHLVECPNRQKTAIAIERFLRYAQDNKRMYEKIYGKKWIPLCREYMDSITKFQYKGYNKRQLIIKKPYTQYLMLWYKLINRLTPKEFRKPGWYNYFPNETAYHACLSEEEFIEKTRFFTEQLCNSVPQKKNTEYIVIDQMIAGNYPERYLRYVNDLKVIVVDRDPRDLYIHHETHKDHVLPKDPYHFCTYYRDNRRKYGRIDKSKVLYVSFEDMIYHYDEMVKRVFDFIGMSSIYHIAPRTHFDPSKSIRGTQLWKTHIEYSEAVTIIESELPEFLYQYPDNN